LLNGTTQNDAALESGKVAQVTESEFWAALLAPKTGHEMHALHPSLSYSDDMFGVLGFRADASKNSGGAGGSCDPMTH
jgi:hypothetical protein